MWLHVVAPKPKQQCLVCYVGTQVSADYVMVWMVNLSQFIKFLKRSFIKELNILAICQLWAGQGGLTKIMIIYQEDVNVTIIFQQNVCLTNYFMWNQNNIETIQKYNLHIHIAQMAALYIYMKRHCQYHQLLTAIKQISIINTLTYMHQHVFQPASFNV